MNRAGLFIALAIALIGGVVFTIFPQFDVWVAHLFYNMSSRKFVLSPLGAAEYVRRAAMWIAWGFAVPAIVALIVKLIRPDKRLLMSGRAVIFLLSTILINAILLPDVVVKHHWGRPRPIATTEFNGSQTFKPWWKAHNGDWHNTSFFSGEAATAFWTYAPAALAPPSLRPLTFTAATVFGLTTGILRMAFGAHYASDIIAAGLAAFLVVWIGYALIYRWNISRMTDHEIDRWLTDKSIKLRSAKTFWLLAAAVGTLTIARLAALTFSVVDLSPDEARYWAWAQMPAVGYFSKPPLIAWIIAGVGRICGSSEMCLRAPAPLFYAATSLI
jgi:lipid A 4'-phosphatase